MRYSLVLLPLLTLAACATAPTGDSALQREMTEAAACEARGGVMVAAGTGFACRNPEATRIVR